MTRRVKYPLACFSKKKINEIVYYRMYFFSTCAQGFVNFGSLNTNVFRFSLRSLCPGIRAFRRPRPFLRQIEAQRLELDQAP